MAPPKKKVDILDTHTGLVIETYESLCEYSRVSGRSKSIVWREVTREIRKDQRYQAVYQEKTDPLFKIDESKHWYCEEHKVYIPTRTGAPCPLCDSRDRKKNDKKIIILDED
jgi:uncharacterized protein YneR